MPATLNDEVKDFQKAGESALSDLQALPAVDLIEEEESYVIQDNLDEGIEITYPNQAGESVEAKKPKTKISLPKDYAQPIEIKLDGQRIITLKDDNGGGYKSDVLDSANGGENATWLQKIFGLNKGKSEQSYLRYQNGRKSILYSYQRERATGERKLKNFIFYEEGNGEEKESYSVENARLEKNDNGDVALYYQTDQDLKNQAAAKDVDPSLMDRAMKTLEKDGMNDSQKSPDLLIPKPYYYDRSGNYQEAEWGVQDNKLTLNIKTTEDKYPLAVDPTLDFTAPGVANGGTSMVGDATSDSFGTTLSSGDINTDGKTDLIVASTGYSTNTGRVYVFYNDGNYASRGYAADIIITGEATSNYFGTSLLTGDFNADGKKDLAVGAKGYSTNTGRVYMFYNDGSMPTTAASADAVMTGETTSNLFGYALATADFNADGKTDLIASATGYAVTFGSGRVYTFYNGSIVTENASGADLFITASFAAQASFGLAMATGDLNADSKIDLAVGSDSFSSAQGNAYLYYNDGSIPTAAGSADASITGPSSGTFGYTLATGDFNADGETDLAVANPSSGEVHFFNNDGSYPASYAADDATTNGPDNRGVSLAVGDFNSDGKTDLLAGASTYSSSTGQAFIFYNDGSYSNTPDVTITGSATSDAFGITVVAGDFNADGKTDVVVGANGTSSSTGTVYAFYSQNGTLNTNRDITGEAGSDLFGESFATGDFNVDGRIDLAVGATGYSAGANTGRVYVFYNDGVMPTGAASSDAIISGEAAGDLFGGALASGDLNADGKTDLAVGAIDAGTSDYGRAYIFYGGSITTENASGADVAIVGVTLADDAFGVSLTTGDMNADGEVDLIVGSYDSFFDTKGRVYIFYNDGSYPTSSSGYSVRITGNAAGDYFSLPSIASGDFNADGRVDLVVGAYNYSSTTGRAYIFYNDGSIPTTAATADVIITGESTSNFFAKSLVAGDLNADGKTDLVVGALGYSTNTGRAYIFYNGSITTENASGADVIITGESSSCFGDTLVTGDLNTDGKTDLVVGAYLYTSSDGRAYIFYNDSSIPTTAATADTIIDGDVGGTSEFGNNLITGDLNADGKTDLVVSASLYNSSQGRVYFYEGRDNYSWTLQRQPLGSSRIQPSVMGEEIRITGQAVNDQFGATLATGDLNADGRVDLVVSATDDSSALGRVYIFYNDGNYAVGADSADVVIRNESSSQYFGQSLAVGDLNADGKADLAVGDYLYSTQTGRAYIFYNDGTYPSLAANADILITGNAASDGFGAALTTGDLNADGKVDLIVGAFAYTSNTGRAYIFYNGSIITEGASGADVTITGNATIDEFGRTMTVGDLNADGKTDLIVGAGCYSSCTGRAYIFYNDGSIPTTAATADVTITGEASSDLFTTSLTTGDFNADGEVDLAVGAPYAASFGRTYIFYNDGSIPTTGATADVIITGDAFDEFGTSLASGDLNADGRADLVVGIRWAYPSDIGRAYIFYNDGAYPSGAASADVTITGEQSEDWFSKSLITGDFNADGKIDLAVGAPQQTSGSYRGKVYMYTMNDAVTGGEASSNYFGEVLTAGDFNADGKTDLLVGAPGYSTSTGRAYIFYGGGALDVSVSSADVVITGNASSDAFGSSVVAEDFNANGTIDFAVGADGYSSDTGRAYIFYNDGTIPTAANSADVIVTGNTSGDKFGYSLTAGDLNADGEVDLVVGAHEYSGTTGRAYILYNDGSYPTTANTANVIITGESNSIFGSSLTAGDFNADSKVDLAVGGRFSAAAGRVYIFYNDGSIPTTAATADVTITGETTDSFGFAVASGDLNADGKTDLTVGAYEYSSITGRVYIFYNDGSIPTTAATADVTIDGQTSSDAFGDALATGDLNGDGRTDLVVGARNNNTSTGRTYVFYNDGSIPSTGSSADLMYDGSATGEYCGKAMTVADFNTDGLKDLAIGCANRDSSSTAGKVYTFITETAIPTGTNQVTPDGNSVSASLKAGTIKMKAGTIQLK